MIDAVLLTGPTITAAAVDEQLPEFAEDARVSLEATTVGGRVEIDEEFALTGEIGPSHVRGGINGGGPKLRLETSGGSIRVRMR